MSGHPTNIYTDIFIDEVQDLAGYDLDFLKLLFKTKINVLLVGDPRQVTYLTHRELKYKKYEDGRIKEFIENECNKVFCKDRIDETSLKYSHRNNMEICKYSSKLYPEYASSEPCECKECRNIDSDEHQGIFLIKSSDVLKYLEKYKPMQLRYDKDVQVNESYPVKNFGAAKGLTFDRVLIYPTKEFIKWIKNPKHKLSPISRSKFYVAITRAKLSVGILCDEKIESNDIKIYEGNA